MGNDSNLPAFEERVLVCAGDGADTELIATVLRKRGIHAEECSECGQLWREVGRGAGAVVLSEEMMAREGFTSLLSEISKQPPWSDLPLILAVGHDENLWKRLRGLNEQGLGVNMTLIETPVREVSLINAVRVAMRARRRQYDVRDLIDQREAILGSVCEPFLLLDRDWRFLYLNERAAEMLGRARTDLLGRQVGEAVPAVLETPYYQTLLQAVEQREPQQVEHFDALAHKWYEMRVYPSRAGLAVFGNDVTERKRTEAALRQSEERLRLMIESAIEYGILSIDCSGKITSWNRGAERILGYREEEIVGQPIDVIYSSEDRARGIPAEERQKALVSGQAEDERWHLRKDGSKFWAGGQMMAMVEADGEVRGFLKILRDYTGRKRAETWLMALNETLEKRVAERTAEAEQRATQLRMLAAELTEAEERERRRLAELLHDHLQQILVAAKMQVGMLSQRPLEEPVLERLEQVDSLLKRSIEASRSLTVELSPPVLYDAGLGPAFQWLARRMAEDHGLQVTVEAEDEVNPESENLRAFLFQAVRELLFNIVKHAGVKEARVTLSRGQGMVEAVVADSGVGFDPEDKRPATGRGFGLFSIGERVKLLGGSVKIQAAPGKGVSVGVNVPLSQPKRTEGIRQAAPGMEEVEVPPRAPSHDEERSAGRIRILLADDHKILREGLAGLLREQPDFEVVSEASDGQMAVAMARETKPDVVIMDVSMPVLNGIEATRRIKEEMPEIQVIALSMHAKEDMAEAMRQARATTYMTKGVPSEILTAAIRDAAKQGKRAARPNVS